MRPILLFLAALIRRVRRWVLAVLVVGLLALNVLTVSTVTAFEMVRGAVFWLAEAASIPVDMVGWRQSLDDRARARTELEGAKADLTDAQRTNAALRTDLDDAQRTNANLQTDLDDAQRTNANLQTDLDDAQRTNANLRTEREALQTQVGKAEANLRTARGDLARVETDLRTTRTELEGAKANLAHARQNAGGIITRIQKRTILRAVRNTAGEVVAWIPVISGVVGAGLVAYEIKDACDTVKDLANLSDALDIDNDSPASCDDYLAGNWGDREQACYAARTASNTLSPPECDGLPLPDTDITIPAPVSPAPAPAPLPRIDLPPSLQ
ncbi:MAG: hypothetical protein GDA52_10160 [Rhodobacteraceae bacterium]|nr:hypothetical protein [Paracoccaceae bacterium]